MRTSVLTATAALAASAIAAPLEPRTTYATWSATNVKSEVAHITVGASFDLNVPAGYVAGAPAFYVNCDISILDPAGRKACTYKGPQAQGSKVEADWDASSNLPITVWHTFGSKTATGTAGLPAYNTDFTITVTSVA
ncbi:hypothetical protein F5B17DRAFT_344821 [Nemania serpens]|nr:hypothetical protein F5B17DRAFT_344821 [Nemania serpens]